jgi:hypothetical protein
VVTTFDLDEYVYTALRNGAYGFLLKDSGPVLRRRPWCAWAWAGGADVRPHGPGDPL